MSFSCLQWNSLRYMALSPTTCSSVCFYIVHIHESSIEFKTEHFFTFSSIWFILFFFDDEYSLIQSHVNVSHLFLFIDWEPLSAMLSRSGRDFKLTTKRVFYLCCTWYLFFFLPAWVLLQICWVCRWNLTSDFTRCWDIWFFDKNWFMFCFRSFIMFFESKTHCNSMNFWYWVFAFEMLG